RADTLVELCQASLGGDANGISGSNGGRATVDVVVDVETLADTDDLLTVARLRRALGRGGPISGPGLDRLLCDASFRALVTDGPRAVLAYNRATPDIPPALRRAVRHRDRHCTFPGCDRPSTWCDLHHLIPRHRGGPTTIDNLTLLCRFHHGTVHEGGWQLARGPDGNITATSP
ncbi:MAG: HNH endonuclease signature motif containing protein, partial [Actinomycetota bacterium]